MMAEERAFHADFSPTTQSLKTVRESWGVQPDKEPPVRSLEREHPSLQAS